MITIIMGYPANQLISVVHHPSSNTMKTVAMMMMMMMEMMMLLQQQVLFKIRGRFRGIFCRFRVVYWRKPSNRLARIQQPVAVVGW